MSELTKYTSFSGSDIQVIAFRDLRSPAGDFTMESPNEELSRIESEIQELRARLASSRNRSASSETQRSLVSQLDQVASPAYDGFGKAQNQESFIETSQAIESIQNQINELEQIRGEVSRRAREKDSRQRNFFNLGTLHSVSYSSFREKYAVRGLGKVRADAYTRGPRTIAGTMVFHLVQNHELYNLIQDEDTGANSGVGSHPNTMMLDQIPSFNLLLLFANEYGSYSTMHMFDLTLASEGQAMSVDEMLTMNTVNFYAQDIVPLTPIGNMFDSYNEMVTGIVADARDLKWLKAQNISDKRKQRIEARITNPFAEDANEIKRLLSNSRGLF